MGAKVSSTTQDSIPVRLFLNRWFEQLLDFPAMADSRFEQAKAEFFQSIDSHNRGIAGPESMWGWKNPRSMWLVPFFLRLYPDLKFLHVVRDARDMALSKNRFLLNKHGDRLLGPSWRQNPEKAQMSLWARGNMHAANSAIGCLPGNYHLLRYEDLCFDTENSLKSLMDFLEIEGKSAAHLASEIKPSTGIGRARKSPMVVDELDLENAAALRRFGYD